MSTTAFNRNPSNPNFLHPNKFQLNFSRLPNVQYFCQSVTIPGISTSEVMRNTPFVDIFSPGEKAIYESFSAIFYVDEELLAWKEIHDWIRAMTFPEKYEEYRNLPNLARTFSNPQFPQFSDAEVTILSSSNKPYYKFKFYDCFPTSLSGFNLSTMETPDTPITSDVMFRYSYYDIQKLFWFFDLIMLNSYKGDFVWQN